MPVSILPQPSTAKCRLGRPQGSKTKDKTAVTPTLELVRIISIIEGFLCLIVYPADLPGVLDGYCGNPTAVLTAFSTVHFFLLNGDMELNKNRQIFVNKML